VGEDRDIARLVRKREKDRERFGVLSREPKGTPKSIGGILGEGFELDCATL
jgi:hypothetical protein